MANLFLDYINGSNANNGTSFALRFKDITAGATAARIVPGDVIRIMKSPDPTSLGIDGTWTLDSSTITLASAVTANITDCGTIWTASASVTCTTSATCKEGSLAASISMATAFATGKAAYFATGLLDLSGYQQVSFWVRTSTAIANNTTLSLRLCTDTVGAVSVHTIAIPALPLANTWAKVTVDLATNLNAAIQSVALYQDTDRAAAIILLDNIIACKASSSADSLSLTSLIGKNASNETWYSIASINGTTVRLDSGNNTLPSAQRGYGGTTETVTTYKRETIKTGFAAAASTAVQTVQDSGTAGNPITYSGGWDTTDMTTQDGETWFDGGSGTGIGLTIVARSYITLSKINFVNYGNAGISISTTSNNQVRNDVACNGNLLDGLLISASGSGNTYTNLVACNNGQYGVNNSGGVTQSWVSGPIIVDGNVNSANSAFTINCASSSTIPLIRCCCNGSSGLSLGSVISSTVTSVIASYNTAGIGFDSGTDVAGTIISAVVANNNGTGFIISASNLGTIGTVTANNNSSTGVLLTGSNITITSVTANSNSTGVNISGANNVITEIVSANSAITYGVIITNSNNYILTITSVSSSQAYGIHIGGAGNRVDDIVACNSNTGIGLSISGANCYVGSVTGNANATGLHHNGRGCTVAEMIMTNTVNIGINWGDGRDNKVLSGSQSGGSQGMTVQVGTGLLNNFTISNVTEISSGGTAFSDYRISSVNHDNTAGNHQVFCDGGLISSETTTRHTASGLAWKMSPTSANRSATYPLKMSLGLYALAAGTVTIKCWMRRSNVGLTAKLVAPINPIVGMAVEVSSSMSAIADTWEELTISVTLSSAGVIELEAQCYGGTTYSCYVDDLTVNGIAVPLDYSWNGQPFCSPLVSATGMIGNGNLNGGFQ